jgi:hypothetical protein
VAVVIWEVEEPSLFFSKNKLVPNVWNDFFCKKLKIKQLNQETKHKSQE